MKVRNSFVTNSSSSSFIVAIKDGVTISDVSKEIEKILKENINRIESFFEDFCEYIYNDEESTDADLCKLYKNKDPKFLNELSKYLAENLFEYRNGAVENWTVEVLECSNEDEELYRSLLYDMGHLFKGESFKLM